MLSSRCGRYCLGTMLQEALRMYPPVGIGQMRVSHSQDITLAGRLHVPAGTVLWVPHHAIQNVSFNWDDPDKFLPGARAAGAGLHQHRDTPHAPSSGTCARMHACKVTASHNINMTVEFVLHAERWLTPGTEYAVPEKLPLPKEWYSSWEAAAAGDKGGDTSQAPDMGGEQSERYARLSFVPVA